jgi:NADP-dependent aldehyde dehydrogenase
MGVGQFCTNPGMLLLEKNDGFITELEQQIANASGGVMLTGGIQRAYQKGIEHFGGKMNLIGKGITPQGSTAVEPVLFKTDCESLIQNPDLAEEVFGPTSVVVEAQNKEQLIEVAKSLTGHLTATVHGTEQDLKENTELLEILEQKVGRLLINAFPTGVEVSHAMVHGGPFPSTTDSRSTSVGTMAIYRFTRPVCYQGFPDFALPEELKQANPLSLWRLVDGERTK